MKQLNLNTGRINMKIGIKSTKGTKWMALIDEQIERWIEGVSDILFFQSVLSFW